MKINTLFCILLSLSNIVHTPILQGSWFSTPRTKPFSIMLDPAGDAKHTGRKLDDSFERGVTLQCAEQLKTMLEQEYPTIRVVLTRFPGESSLPLQNANFANRLDVDLYIRIQFYQETETKPHLYIYSFSNGNDFVSLSSELAFHPYDKIHLNNQKTTDAWISLMVNQLDQSMYKQQCTVHSPLKIPFKELAGIKAPALTFEAGIKTKDDWSHYVHAFAESLKPIIAQYQTT